MKRSIAIWAVAAAASLFVMPQAFGATAAGTKVRNVASVTFKVGGVTQTVEPVNQVEFVVDRRVDINVSADASSYSATPGQLKAAAYFTVTNSSNDMLDVKLTVANLAATTVTAGPDGKLSTGDDIPASEANSSGLTLYYDTGTPGWDASDVEVAKDGTTDEYYIPDLAGDGGSKTIMVVKAEISPLGDESDAAKVQNGDTLGVSLAAEARSAYNDPTGATGLTWPSLPAANLPVTGTMGAPTWSAGTANTLGDAFTVGGADGANTVETVFADSADLDSSAATGAPGEANNGQDASYTVFTITAAAITVTKQSAVYWDPVNLFGGTVPAKAIPGAMVLYCVTVENAAGSPTATGVAISDNIPTNTSFENGGTDTDGDGTNGVQPLDPDGATATYPALSNQNSIRFSTAATCTAADWDDASLTSPPTGSEVEDDDATSEGTGSIGNYASGVISTTVDTLAAGARTTTMFLVKIN